MEITALLLVIILYFYCHTLPRVLVEASLLKLKFHRRPISKWSHSKGIESFHKDWGLLTTKK